MDLECKKVILDTPKVFCKAKAKVRPGLFSNSLCYGYWKEVLVQSAKLWGIDLVDFISKFPKEETS